LRDEGGLTSINRCRRLRREISTHPKTLWKAQMNAKARTFFHDCEVRRKAPCPFDLIFDMALEALTVTAGWQLVVSFQPVNLVRETCLGSFIGLFLFLLQTPDLDSAVAVVETLFEVLRVDASAESGCIRREVGESDEVAQKGA
jgi:hypothetical protein